MLVVVVIIQKREIILMDDRSIVMDCFWNLIEVRKFWIQRCSSLIGIWTIECIFFSNRSYLSRRRRLYFIIVIVNCLKSVSVLELRSVSKIGFFNGIYRLI